MRRILLLAFLLFIGGTSSALAQAGSLERISRASPFNATCGGPAAGGTVYVNAEVEPWVSANPRNDDNLVAVWQQDRWSNGGAQGNLTGVSFDRGRSWRLPTPPPFSRCAGGAYDRASDPWVSFGGDGSAHQIALAISADQTISAILVSSSRDGGRTWGPITTLQRDTTASLFNDKESITADPRNGRFVYAVWDRLQIENPANPASRFSGDTLFARSTDGGRTWEPTRTILDFPDNSNTQTLGNEIVVLSDGTVVNVFDMIVQGTPFVAVQRSTDRGVTWSAPIIVDVLFSSATQGQGVVDPRDGAPIRTGDLLVEAAADPRRRSDTIHIVWQDIRFTLAAPLPIFNDQIVIASSEDGGLTWSDPKRISSNKLTQAFTGSVEVNEDGDIGVTYYDFTADDPAGIPLQTDYWFTSSRDDGATFSARRRLTERSFDMRTAPFANGFFVGDYEGLTTADDRFLPVFVTANDGNLANRTDVFSTAIRAQAAAKSSRARAARRVGRVSATRLA
ncbi:MAG TPA: sialidase family protein, partial [Solirubrobacteraceae bacterium]|nr:sialidase family protein [Solirubrobacteraceae bacterium]